MTNYRRLTKKAREKLTPEQKKEREREMLRLRTKRYRAKHTLDERRRKKAEDDARCYRWEALLPHIEKEPDDGCWIWRGPYTCVFGHSTRPVIRQGFWGRQYADHVVACLHRGKPLPPGCFLTRSCGRLECVSPKHIQVTNHSVERAKRRLAHDDEEKRRGRAREAG